MTEQILKQVDLEKFTAKLIEPGLVENYIKPGMHMEPRDAWELKKINQDMNEGNPYGVLIVSGHLSSVSKEAREIVASREFVGQTVAKALLVDSLGHRIVGNFYLSVNKPFIKTRIFTDRTEAIKWLKGQIAPLL